MGETHALHLNLFDFYFNYLVMVIELHLMLA